MEDITNQNIMIRFPVEEIPNNQKLFYRIHKVNIDESETDKIKKIKPVAFDPQPKELNSVQMSVNWEKYSTAESTKLSARKPELNGVLSFNSSSIRLEPINLNVTHSPTTNQAHSHIHDIVSEKNDPEIRILLRESCSWEIEL